MTPEWLDQFRRPLILYPPGKAPNPPISDVWRVVIDGEELEEWVLGGLYEEGGKEWFMWMRDRPRKISRWEKFRMWLRRA